MVLNQLLLLIDYFTQAEMMQMPFLESWYLQDLNLLHQRKLWSISYRPGAQLQVGQGLTTLKAGPLKRGLNYLHNWSSLSRWLPELSVSGHTTGSRKFGFFNPSIHVNQRSCQKIRSGQAPDTDCANFPQMLSENVFTPQLWQLPKLKWHSRRKIYFPSKGLYMK